MRKRGEREVERGGCQHQRGVGLEELVQEAVDEVQPGLHGEAHALLQGPLHAQGLVAPPGVAHCARRVAAHVVGVWVRVGGRGGGRRGRKGRKEARLRRMGGQGTSGSVVVVREHLTCVSRVCVCV